MNVCRSYGWQHEAWSRGSFTPLAIDKDRAKTLSSGDRHGKVPVQHCWTGCAAALADRARTRRERDAWLPCARSGGAERGGAARANLRGRRSPRQPLRTGKDLPPARPVPELTVMSSRVVDAVDRWIPPSEVWPRWWLLVCSHSGRAARRSVLLANGRC